jgi:ornithine cyclodeaminase
MRDAVELMKRAFAALSRRQADVPLRTHLAAKDGEGITLVMPARVDAETSLLAVKVVSVFDGNAALGIPRIQGAVLVLEPDTGRPLALLEGSALTAIRTAAASGAATDLLARPDSGSLAVVGAGVQARSHIEAICAVRPITAIRVYSRTAADVDRLIDDMARAPWCAARIVRAETAAEAVRGADVVCTTTTSSTPVFDDDALGPGAHVNAVGAYTSGAREIGADTVARSWVVVDERTAAWEEAGDLIQARDEGRIDAGHVQAELGELVLRPDLRPTDLDRPTLFKSVGLAVQDAVAASAAVEAAARSGLGTVVNW